MQLILKIIVLTLFFSCCLTKPIDSNDQTELDQTINFYFQYWSEKKMSSYRNLFHRDAIIQFRTKYGSIITERLDDFIEGQTRALQNSEQPMKEIPLNKKFLIKNGVAQVTVYWRLTIGTKQITGYDYFTFSKDMTGWKIQYLMFQNEE